MALVDAIQNSRYVAQQITWSDSDGNAVDLAGAALTAKIRNGEGRVRDVDGTLAIITAASGIFSWTYGAVDVATVGEFEVQFIATYGSGLKDKTLVHEWEVLDALDD